MLSPGLMMQVHISALYIWITQAKSPVIKREVQPSGFEPPTLLVQGRHSIHSATLNPIHRACLPFFAALCAPFLLPILWSYFLLVKPERSFRTSSSAKKWGAGAAKGTEGRGPSFAHRHDH